MRPLWQIHAPDPIGDFRFAPATLPAPSSSGSMRLAALFIAQGVHMTDTAPSRRSLLSMIGVVAGSAAMYHAMTELGYANESTFKGPIKLSPPPLGSSVLVLGAGVAGMVAAMELRDAGYKVQVLEYNGRPGGRNWSLYGGDTYTELGGAVQHVQFDKGQYINPRPWRLPYHPYAMLQYCKELGVELEPFVQVNYNAYVHSTEAYGGKPQRYR